MLFNVNTYLLLHTWIIIFCLAVMIFVIHLIVLYKQKHISFKIIYIDIASIFYVFCLCVIVNTKYKYLFNNLII